MVNTAPATTALDAAPIDWMITFSRIVLLRAKTFAIPMAMMAIGIAASIPCPVLRAR